MSDDPTPSDFDPDLLTTIDMPCEFYLKGRSESVFCLVAILVTKEALEQERGREALMDMALNFIMTKLNSRNELWAILPASNGARQVIVLDELQSFSVMPYDEPIIDKYTPEVR